MKKIIGSILLAISGLIFIFIVPTYVKSLYLLLFSFEEFCAVWFQFYSIYYGDTKSFDEVWQIVLDQRATTMLSATISILIGAGIGFVGYRLIKNKKTNHIKDAKDISGSEKNG